MAKITLTGNLFIQLAGESKPAPLPLNLELDYTEKSVVDYAWTLNQTNLALNQGTVTSPRFIFVEVTEGDLRLSTSSAGTGAMKFAANPTPATGDSPARGLMFTYDASAAQFYANTIGPTRAKIWFFE
jgi:hypothetical protein